MCENPISLDFRSVSVEVSFEKDECIHIVKDDRKDPMRMLELMQIENLHLRVDDRKHAAKDGHGK